MVGVKKFTILIVTLHSFTIRSLSLIHISSLDKAYKLKPMQYRLTIPYRVQISTSHGVQADSGVVDADVLHSLQRCV